MILYRNRFRWVAMLVIAALAAVGAPPAHAKAPVVTDVQVKPGASGKLSVHVSATGEVKTRVITLTDPRNQLVVEVSPAQLATDVPKSYEVNQGIVERVRVGQFSDKDNIVRVVVDLNAPAKYQLNMAHSQKAFMLSMDTQATAAAKATTATAATGSTGAPALASVPRHAVAVRTAPAITYKGKAAVRVAESTTPDVSPSHTYVVHNTKPIQVAQASRRRAATRRYTSANRHVSLDFVNADLIYVLKILAKEMNVNLVTDSTVKGSVTMSLKDVPASSALQLILKIAGFDYKLFGNTLVVGSAETIAKIPNDIMNPNQRPLPGGQKQPVLPIPLEHAKAQSIAETIKSVYPDAKVTVQADQNFVVVTAGAAQLRDIKEFVQKLDVPPPPPVVLKTEIIPIKYGDVQTVLQLAKTLYGTNLSFNVESRLNSLIVTGQDKDIEALKAFLATVDIPLQQVMLDIRMVTLSEDGTKALGVSIGSGGTFGIFGGTSGPITFTEATPGGTGTTGSLAIAPFTRTPFVIGATLSLLVSRNDAKVIATPRVMCQSGKDAQVLIGDKFPIVYFDPRAGQFQVQYVDIGVKMVVKPTVSADGYVTVDMAPEVSVLKSLINNQYPRTGVTTVKTNVRVRDGDTIIVGGLLREAETYTIQKLPFLGDLPVLGEFFRNTNVERTKDEVFITVTPKIMQ
jgi:type II secretory pathway component GspD/PulD (secretin)